MGSVRKCDLCLNTISCRTRLVEVWDGEKIVGRVCNSCGVDQAPLSYWVSQVGEDCRAALVGHEDCMISLDVAFSNVIRFRGRVEIHPRLSTSVVLAKVEQYLSAKKNTFVIRMRGREEGWPDFCVMTPGDNEVWIFCRPQPAQQEEMSRLRNLGMRVISTRSLRSIRRVF